MTAWDFAHLYLPYTLAALGGGIAMWCFLQIKGIRFERLNRERKQELKRTTEERDNWQYIAEDSINDHANVMGEVRNFDEMLAHYVSRALTRRR